jgi:SAM-dependent methyltransferase
MAPTVTWPSPGARTTRPLPCPNCGAKGPKPLVLSIGWETLDHPHRGTQVLRCPSCSCCFYDNQTPPDYTEPALLERGRVPFYLQQGAGISLFTSPLAKVRKPPGSFYLDVGCGFGFGLDFAVHTRRWQGKGIDPAPLSGLGRSLLGLDIELRYFDATDTARFSCDVIMSSETIEHVPSPPGFLRTLASALKPDGIMILTTPDADAILPSTPPGALLPLLSPGLHLVLQTEQSLRALLAGAGLPHIVVYRDSYSLVAFASRVAFALEEDRNVVREMFRAHLEQRASAVPPDGDLFLAFAGRALQESVNDGDLARARRVWALLDPVCQARFGLQLDEAAIPPDAQAGPLERMATLRPINLAGLLYSRGMLRLMEGESRAVIEPLFRAGAASADALRRALHEIAVDDAMTEQISWICRAEACLCSASRGAPDTLQQLRALSAAPGDEGFGQRRSIALRALVTLVNAGHYALARELEQAEGIGVAPFADPTFEGGLTEAERDAVFVLAVMDMRDGNPAQGRARFARVRASVAAEIPGHEGRQTPPLYWAALRGGIQASEQLGDPAAIGALCDEMISTTGGGSASVPDDLRARLQSRARTRFVELVNAGDYERARPLRTWFDIDRMRQSEFLPDSERDVLFCSGILDLQQEGDPARALASLGRVRRSVARASAGAEPPPLFWAALRGEMLAANRSGTPDDGARIRDEAFASLSGPSGNIPDDLLPVEARS